MEIVMIKGDKDKTLFITYVLHTVCRHSVTYLCIYLLYTVSVALPELGLLELCSFRIRQLTRYVFNFQNGYKTVLDTNSLDRYAIQFKQVTLQQYKVSC